MMDKDGDGRVSKADVEAVVGKIMTKKHKEEDERKLELQRREEERQNMISPLKHNTSKSPIKEKVNKAGKSIEKPTETVVKKSKKTEESSKDKSMEKSAKKSKQPKESKEAKDTKETKEKKSSKSKSKK